MNHATPIIILLLALWLCVTFIIWAAPRALALAVVLTGEIVTFLFRCAHEVYDQRQWARGST